MLMDALIDVVEDEGIKQYYRNTFIHHPVTGAKFRVLGSNEAFFRDLLDDKYPTPESDGQERMQKAYDRIRLRESNRMVPHAGAKKIWRSPLG